MRAVTSAQPQRERKYTLEEYAALEEQSEERLEYFEGNVWSTAGASISRETIVSNIDFGLRTKLAGRRCRVFLSNTRIKVPAYPPYRYPDLTALCGELMVEKFHGLEVLTNPALIIEILSPSTENIREKGKTREKKTRSPSASFFYSNAVNGGDQRAGMRQAPPMQNSSIRH